MVRRWYCLLDPEPPSHGDITECCQSTDRFTSVPIFDSKDVPERLSRPKRFAHNHPDCILSANHSAPTREVTSTPELSSRWTELLTNLMNRANVGMDQRRRGPSFALSERAKSFRQFRDRK